MAVRAFLRGHEFDLTHLASLFPVAEQTGVGREADNFFLTSPELTQVSGDAAAMISTAAGLLGKFNGIARLAMPDHELVELTGSFYDDEARGHHAVISDVSIVRSRVSIVATTINGGAPLLSEPPAQKQLRITGQVAEVREALTILSGSEQLGFLELYKIYEIVRSHPAGRAVLRGRGAIDARQVNSFTLSANHPDISGTDARHARMNGSPSSAQRMELPAARAFISQLLTAWVDAIADTTEEGAPSSSG